MIDSSKTALPDAKHAVTRCFFVGNIQKLHYRKSLPRHETLARTAIVEGLNIHYIDIYHEVKDIQKEVIITKDGKKYKLKLEEMQ